MKTKFKLHSFQLNESDQKNLNNLVKLTNQTKSNVIRFALVNYLNDQLI